MNMRTALAALCSAVPALSALGQGTITDGPANFALAATPFDITPTANFTGVSATLSQDHIFETGWWYRLGGATAEKFFPVPTMQNYAGSVATLSWVNVDSLGFNAELVYTVINGGASGHVIAQMSIENPGAADISINLYHFADFDVAPNVADDSATLFTPNTTIRLTDPGGNFAFYHGVKANAFLVRPFGANDVSAELSDAAVDNFNNSGLPFGPGDFTGGFQWAKAVIPPGGQRCFTALLAVNLEPSVPCGADSNADCVVDVSDMVNVIIDWGTNGAANGGDVDGNGIVDVNDLVAVVVGWGPC
jgi:hypothetical protein